MGFPGRDAVLGRYLAAAADGRESVELAEEFAKDLPELMSGKFSEFAGPWMSALSKGAATEAELAGALREFTSDYNAIGALWAPFMTAALVIQVDLSHAAIPDFRPDTGRHWFKPSRPDPFLVSATWYAPTRHPADLRAAVTAPAILRAGGQA